ncbi:MAG: hypothetical protein ACKO0V_10690 [bacterium]
MRQAREIWKVENSFALSMYCAGLAVESMLRAFRWSEDTSFEGRHDLAELLKASQILRIDDEYMKEIGATENEITQSYLAIRSAMNQVVVLWHNNLRFASEETTLAFLKKQGKIKGLKGNALKQNATELLEAAQLIINRGATLWISKKKS